MNAFTPISMKDALRAEAAIEPDAVPVLDEEAPAKKETQIIAIYGKGGIGKSFTLANLSYMMAQQGKKVLLIGCDPKSDTTSLLFGGKACPTIIETSAKMKAAGAEITISDVCFKRDGVYAMELGGPEVGRGCGGRGIIHGFELLEKLGFHEWGFDFVLLDFLGDVVCGGFGLPIARDMCQKVIVVASNDLQSLYVANNVCSAVEYFRKLGGNVGVAGMVINKDDHTGEAQAFAKGAGIPDFGPHWHSLRQVNFGRNECLGLVELPADYRAEIQDYALHPALMDIATGVAMYLIPGYDHPGDLLLPFAYKRVTVYGALPPRVHSHARLRPESSSDLILFDITLATDAGEVIAEIEEFTIKRLRSVADLARADSTASASPRDNGAAELLHGIPTREGIEALKRILKSRATEMVYVSPITLSPVAPMREAAALIDSVTAPSDDIDLVLEQLWQRLLGLDHVDATTDFFDSGGHSLLAVRLFTEIRKRFNIDFGLSTLFEARTVGALADLVRKARGTDPSQKSAALNAGLVAIRSSATTNTPLFLIHDVGGGVLRYEHLARHFPDDQAIYAIESRGLSGHPTDYTVEEMATHYITQIRERQPHGPYFVAGHSFGGLVTYEIARQLTAQGETMGLVGLLDTFQRNLSQEDAAQQIAPRTDKLPFFQRFVTDARAVILGQDRIGYLQERTTYVQAWAVKTTYRTAFKLSNRYGWRMPSFLNNVMEANWIASDYFTPGTYAGEVVLFRCLNRLDTDPPDSLYIWQRMATSVVILECPGDHNSMLREPGVGILAEQILGFLKPKSPSETPSS